MTLLDFCRMLKRHIALVIALPLVCALGCFAYFSFVATKEITYTATSRIVVTTHLQDANGLASSVARSAASANRGINVKTAIDSNTKTVSINVTGSDKQRVIDAANEVAEAAREQAVEFIQTSPDDPFNARVEEANEASGSSSDKDLYKYVLVALLVGFFIASCILVINDMVRRPIKSVEGIQSVTELPVLEVLPVKDKGERLLANVRFASKMDNQTSICFVPVGDEASSNSVAEVLVAAAKEEGLEVCIDPTLASEGCLTVASCKSLSQGMNAAYCAREADATVLVVRQWADSLTSLESTASELKLAGSNLIGIVFVK